MNDDYWDLVDRLVPEFGVADTEQGELVRAVVRLTAECCRNGCGNWDDYFETLTQFALERFLDGTLDDSISKNAEQVLQRLRAYGRDPDSSSDSTYGELCREIDDPLEIAAVQWCQRHSSPIPFKPSSDYGAID